MLLRELGAFVADFREQEVPAEAKRLLGGILQTACPGREMHGYFQAGNVTAVDWLHADDALHVIRGLRWLDRKENLHGLTWANAIDAAGVFWHGVTGEAAILARNRQGVPPGCCIARKPQPQEAKAIIPPVVQRKPHRDSLLRDVRCVEGEVPDLIRHESRLQAAEQIGLAAIQRNGLRGRLDAVGVCLLKNQRCAAALEKRRKELLLHLGGNPLQLFLKLLIAVRCLLLGGRFRKLPNRLHLRKKLCQRGVVGGAELGFRGVGKGSALQDGLLCGAENQVAEALGLGVPAECGGPARKGAPCVAVAEEVRPPNRSCLHLLLRDGGEGDSHLEEAEAIANSRGPFPDGVIACKVIAEGIVFLANDIHDELVVVPFVRVRAEVHFGCFVVPD